MLSNFSFNDAYRVIANVIDERIRALTKSGAGVEVSWGTVASLDVEATCSVYLLGEPVPSSGFRLENGLKPNLLDPVRVNIDKRGNRWVDAILNDSTLTHSKLEIDPRGGEIRLGDGIVAPSQKVKINSTGIIFDDSVQLGAKILGIARYLLTNRLLIEPPSATSNGLVIKLSTDAHDRLRFLGNGEIYFGSGSTSPGVILYKPSTINSLSLGPDNQLISFNEQWISPSFVNGWTHYSDPNYSPAQYRKDAQGYVHMQGLVSSGTIGSTMFTLPTGYKPSKNLIFSTVSSGSHTEIRVLDTGSVFAIGGTNSWVSLSPISFKAA